MMDSGVTNNATMESEQIKSYQQMLLSNVLSQKLEENEKRIKTITDYKNRHKKVIEGLQVYPLSLSENCMVPIGKRAFMKGKLTHTNEVVASLGDGYFAKYSASQAIALCNRRIAWADEMLKSLETERNLYEMRQNVPLQHDVFGEEDRKDIMEHWTENKLDEWRVRHRQREKEYHKKLSKLREKEKTGIHTEEELFKRLDELELEEELEDEIYRLEAERKEFYGDDVKEGEIYDESDLEITTEDYVSDLEITTEGNVPDLEITTEMIQKEREKLQYLLSDTSGISSDTVQDKILDSNATKNAEQSHFSAKSREEVMESCSPEPRDISKNTSMKERGRISFAEPCVIEDKGNMEEETVMPVSQEACSVLKKDDTYNQSSEDEDDIIRIEFSHSLHIPDTLESSNIEIQSPRDIYKMFSAPKSILKRSPNDMIPNQIAPPLNEDSSTDTEDEDEYTKHSAYNSAIKEKVQESKISPINEISKKDDGKRIVSRFKLERAARKE